MYNMGLLSSKKRDFEALLASHHSIEIGVSILDMSHNEISTLTNRFLGGQVTYDGSAEVSRGVDLDLLDPTGALHLDSNSPDAGALFADRMVRVKYTVVNPTGTVRFTCPLFTGPIEKMDRNGAAVQVSALGKESLGMSPAWNSKTFKEGYLVTSAIRYILVNIMGENKLSIPRLRKKITRNVTVGGDRLPWQVAKSLASSVGYHLYYDGLGICRMRKMPGAVSFTFRGKAGGTLKSEPEIGFDMSKTINAVEVWGKKPNKAQTKKGKKRPHYRIVAARSHPFSPWNLGRPGRPRYIPLVEEDDAIRTNVQAKARAKSLLKSGLRESVDVKFDTLVVPHLEEMDMVKVSSDKFSSVFRLSKFAIPLSSSGTMSVGYVKNVNPKKTAIRSRAARKKR